MTPYRYEYECPDCGCLCSYSQTDFDFAKEDGHCHECAIKEDKKEIEYDPAPTRKTLE